MLPVWTANSMSSKTHSETRDGIIYKDYENETLFCAYFYLSGEQVIHNQRLFTLLGLISEIGGLFSVIFTFSRIIGRRLNRNLLLSKITRAMFMIVSNDKKVERANTVMATQELVSDKDI